MGKGAVTAKLAKTVSGKLDEGLSALRSSYAERMGRAADQGFDTDIFHKTWSDNFDTEDSFSSFDPEKMQQSDYGYAGKGVYATPAPLGGSTYGNVSMPLKTNMRNPYVRTNDNWQDDLDPYQWIPANSDKYDSMEDTSAAWTEMMQKKGHGGFIDKTSDNGEIVVFDPKNIRSTNAQFDPAKADSSNLLAGVGGAAVLGGALVPEEAEASFAGVAARNADDMMLGIARKMKDFGVTRDEIWKKTGWGEGVDGKWRFELDDSNLAMKHSDDKVAGEVAEYPMGSIGDVLSGDEIIQNYPDMADIRATSTTGRGGSFSPDDGFGGQRINYATTSSGAHELQHGIQERENFARGGNPGEFFGDLDGEKRIIEGEISALNGQMTDIVRQKDMARELGDSGRVSFLDEKYQKVMSERVKMVSDLQSKNLVDPVAMMATAQKKYLSLAGETEARNVQKRLDMTPQERRASPPWETQDVADADQIVRMRGSASPEMLAATAALTAGAAALTPYAAEASTVLQGLHERRQAKQGVWQRLRADLSDGIQSGSDLAMEALEALDMPMKGMIALSGVAGQLAAGSSMDQALQHGANQVNQPLEQTTMDLGGVATDAIAQTPLSPIAPAVGAALHTGLLMGGL